MSKSSGRKIFVNLAVRDLKRAKAFFSALGFDFNPKFTDDKGACMVVSDEGYVMLLAEPFFKSFTTRQVCDTSRQTEALIALSCYDLDGHHWEVMWMDPKAVEAGPEAYMASQQK